jgi:hypothetical protein
MRPRVYSLVWRNIATDEKTRRWHVGFKDSCGCQDEEDFGTFASALRFALHIAGGGDRWQFVA